MIKKSLIAIVGLIILVTISSLFIPSKYNVERSILINAPAEKIFALLNDLKKHPAWSPWLASDSTMKFSYGKKSIGVGAVYTWKSSSSGSGKMTITVSKKNQLIKTDLQFKGSSDAKGYWTLKKVGDKIKLTQGFDGKTGLNPLAKFFSLTMDSMIGPYFEKGLKNIKKIAEKKSKDK